MSWTLETLSAGPSPAAAPRRDGRKRELKWRRERRLFYSQGFSSSLSPLHHLITRSALASTFGGIVRPICLAVFKLMINSNFFGCSTGRSAGLAPFKILSTYVAARRDKSAKLTP